MTTKPVALKDNSDTTDRPHDEARDTIPDRESNTPPEQSRIQALSGVELIIAKQRSWYTERNLVVSDLDGVKLKFCFSLFRLIQKEFLRPVANAMQQGATNIEATGEHYRTAYLEYLEMLKAPQFQNSMPANALVELRIMGLMESWAHPESINRIRDQIRDILKLPVPKLPTE